MSNLYWTTHQQEFKDILLNYQNVEINNKDDIVFTEQSLFFKVLEPTPNISLAKYGKNREFECVIGVGKGESRYDIWRDGRCPSLPADRCASITEWSAHDVGKTGGSGGRCKKQTSPPSDDENVYYFHLQGPNHILIKECLSKEDFPFYKFMRLVAKN